MPVNIIPILALITIFVALGLIIAGCYAMKDAARYRKLRSLMIHPGKWMHVTTLADVGLKGTNAAFDTYLDAVNLKA